MAFKLVETTQKKSGKYFAVIRYLADVVGGVRFINDIKEDTDQEQDAA